MFDLPMKVLFDYQAFELQKIGGVSRSYAELISRLGTNGCEPMVGIKESDNVYLMEKRLAHKIHPLNYMHDLLFTGGKWFRGQRMATRKIIELFGYSNDCWQVNRDYCIKLLKRHRFDVFEPTFYDSYFLPYIKKTPFVITIHDMIPELFSQYYSRDDLQIMQKKLLCPLANHIHVPSERTKEDLIGLLDICPDKVTVVPHGAPEIVSGEELSHKLFDFPYVLYVGERNGYKNFVPFLKIFANVVKDNKDIRLVCTGKDFNKNEECLIRELNLEDSIIHFFADRITFGSLYHNAIAFVYPSAYEGFGMPILEAFAYGCPVMLNEASCFPEVGGDAAIYFNMGGKQSDFYEKFKYLYSMCDADRQELIDKGKERLQRFSWDNSAKKLMAIYNSLI